MVNLGRNSPCSIMHYYCVNWSDCTVCLPMYIYDNEKLKLSVLFQLEQKPTNSFPPDKQILRGYRPSGHILISYSCLCWYYKCNMEWGSQLKRDPQMPVHTKSSSISLLLRWAKKYTLENRLKFFILSVIWWNELSKFILYECRQTRDRTNGHLVDSNTLLVEINSTV